MLMSFVARAEGIGITPSFPDYEAQSGKAKITNVTKFPILPRHGHSSIPCCQGIITVALCSRPPPEKLSDAPVLAMVAIAKTINKRSYSSRLMVRITWSFSSRYISVLSFLDPDSLPHALRLVFQIDPPSSFAIFAFGETFLEAFLVTGFHAVHSSGRVAAHPAGGHEGS